MLVTVKGKYRHDLPGHTEHGIKEYSVTFTCPKEFQRGELIVQAAKLMKEKDSSFDSFNTHDITFRVENTPEVEPPDGEEIFQ